MRIRIREGHAWIACSAVLGIFSIFAFFKCGVTDVGWAPLDILLCFLADWKWAGLTVISGIPGVALLLHGLDKLRNDDS